MLDRSDDRTLRDLLDEQVERQPDKTWLVVESAAGEVVELTYAEFATRVDAVAAGLAETGVGPGDRVTVQLRNGVEVVETWFALATLGAVFVPSNVANTAPELRHVIGHSGSVLVVAAAEFRETVAKAVIEGCPGVREVVVVGRAEAGERTLDDLRRPGVVPPRAGSADEVVETIFTSGTTSRPKGVLLTHANSLFGGAQAASALHLDGTDRLLTALPVFHVNAQACTILAALTVGGSCVLLEEYRATRFWDQVRRHGATEISLVAMQARTLLAQPECETDREHAVRRVFYALNIGVDERDSFERRYGVELVNGYGLSEAMVLVTLAPVFGPKRWPSIGLPLDERTVRLVGPDGEDVAQGEVGEIVVRGRPGRSVMLGYHDDPTATAAALQDGWLRTGDNAYADERGYLFFFDRGKDMIKRSGENISSMEVEAVLLDHPDVAEAAVVGVPDPVRDEAVKAWLAPLPGRTLDEAEILAFCRERLASFKVPTIVELRDELPKTSIGKIEKKSLR
ncbi:AMP-binding protein [Pseudonocardia xishanensis]|uniref:Crotonobetaine/carnitine-CoA ligase n=1 Tax=Pseudonocardia xishanensis TaxID=630995 RepID=A0ABP8RWF1_9PSEU